LLAYKLPIYRVIIVSDEYRLSLSAIILLPSWAFGWVGFVKRMSELRESDGIFVRSSNIDICVCVCIDIRFRFVAVWSEAESPDCRLTEEVIEYFDHFVDLMDVDESVLWSKKGLNRWCR